jgi:Fur family transcriptional regulator, ferric uptake regulator
MRNDIESARTLREHGFRATFGRVALLETLKKAPSPMTVERLTKSLRQKINPSNAYRALEAFIEEGLVRRIDLGREQAYYELAEGVHHHHLMCESCGKITDVEMQEQEIERAALRAARDFKSIRTHSLEFFGTCKACAA